jgi:uncharacterized membrane protein YphA (DoxX/SURF4 family)
MQDRHLNNSWWALRVAFGVVPIVAGLDKFTNLLADWPGYLSPIAARLLPFSASTFMHLAGLVEIAVGVLILTRFTRLAAYAASAWLVCIALNLVTTGRFFDVAVRDLVMAVGAFVLAQLSEAREAASEPAARRSPSLAAARTAGQP